MPEPTVSGPDPHCKKCGGKGWFAYDHNHMQVCDACCKHHMGWWLLTKHYGKDNGRWCCMAGCGALYKGTPPKEEQKGPFL